MSAKNVIKEQYKKIKTHESKTKSITSALEFLETRLEQLERLTNIAEDLRIDAMARQVSNMVWKNFTRKDIVLLASKLTPFQLEVLGLFRELNGTSKFHEGL
ncbi:MAG: hypothetical protein KDH96_09980, partial [Candidatus Riesia sp.]|nr:hypothetical protein [Candidatus Riesia sp.]